MSSLVWLHKTMCVVLKHGNTSFTDEYYSQFSQNQYTMGPTLRETTIHVDIVRTTLNRNLNKLLPQVIDEISVAFSKDLGSKLLEGQLT